MSAKKLKDLEVSKGVVEEKDIESVKKSKTQKEEAKPVLSLVEQKIKDAIQRNKK